MISYRNKNQLRRVYEQEKSLRKTAEVFGCNTCTILVWMKKYNLKRQTKNTDKPPYLSINSKGYFVLQHHDGESQKRVRIHRLVAVAEFGFDSVVNMDVHHRNEQKLDNRPKNLQIMTHSEHKAHHNTTEDGDYIVE